MRTGLIGITGLCAALSGALHGGQPTAQGGAPLVGVSVASRSAVIAPEQAGKIVEMPFREGDRVQKDAPLFRLNSRLEELEVERLRPIAEKNLIRLKAEISLRHAEQQERRVRDLRDKDIASDRDLETATVEVELARLRLEQADIEQAQAQNQLDQAIERLAQRTVKCPFSGLVTQRLKSEGESVERFAPVLEVMSLDPLWIEFDCPITSAGDYRVGSEVTVAPYLHPQDRRTSKVVYASMKANASSHTFLVRVAVPNPDLTWKAGLKMAVERADADAAEPRPMPKPMPMPGK